MGPSTNMLHIFLSIIHIAMYVLAVLDRVVSPHDEMGRHDKMGRHPFGPLKVPRGLGFWFTA